MLENYVELFQTSANVNKTCTAIIIIIIRFVKRQNVRRLPWR